MSAKPFANTTNEAIFAHGFASARCGDCGHDYFVDMVLRVFLRVVAQSLQSHSPGAVQVGKAALHIGAVAFIHRFGSSLNEHVHFHVCVVDGLFEKVMAKADGQDATDADVQASPARLHGQGTAGEK